MKLEKAIKILVVNKIHCEFKGNTEELVEALQLGIEALKYIREWRLPGHGGATIRLPGETEE